MKTMKTLNKTDFENGRSSCDIKHSPTYLFFKRACDIFFSLFLITLLSPFFIIFSLIIFMTDWHCPIYLHERVGRGGKSFKICKFRSMYHDSDNLEKYLNKEQIERFRLEYKLADDPRITPFGKFIRKFSIDELPQLFNVFAGHMSLIGPRPLTLDETYFFGDEREKLLSVRPGVTGLWQVSGRNALTYESGKRQKCEISYVENFGFKMDVKIFFKTFSAVFGGGGV